MNVPVQRIGMGGPVFFRAIVTHQNYKLRQVLQCDNLLGEAPMYNSEEQVKKCQNQFSERAIDLANKQRIKSFIFTYCRDFFSTFDSLIFTQAEIRVYGSFFFFYVVSSRASTL